MATSALRTAYTWAFEDLGLHRLEHATGNLASCAVAVKAGFVMEGIRRKHGLHLDGWHDMHLHSLLADDPR